MSKPSLQVYPKIKLVKIFQNEPDWRKAICHSAKEKLQTTFGVLNTIEKRIWGHFRYLPQYYEYYYFRKNMYSIITDIIVRILGDVFNLWPSDRWFRKTCSSFQRRDILRNLFRHVWTKLHEVDPYYFNAFSYKFLSSLASKNQIFYIKIHCPVAFCLKKTLVNIFGIKRTVRNIVSNARKTCIEVFSVEVGQPGLDKRKGNWRSLRFVDIPLA